MSRRAAELEAVRERDVAGPGGILLAGTLPGDKERLLRTIDRALAEGESILRPEYLRAL
ncbi:MAG: hypothetical protein MUP64_10870 [Anaerolineae bacterium]|nr:hypothetical protein [Anaerolineae bacterium]